MANSSSSEGWSHVKPGRYEYREGQFLALIIQDGELWRNFVWFDGLEIDRGEWDSRGLALQNARRAIKQAKLLRTPLRSRRDDDEDEEI